MHTTRTAEEIVAQFIRDDIWPANFLGDHLGEGADCLIEWDEIPNAKEECEECDGEGGIECSCFLARPGGECPDCDDGVSACYECDGTGEVDAAPEIFEWYLCSRYLGEKIAAQGGVAFWANNLGQWVWGRTETGQSLTMDGDLSRVAEEIAR